MMVKVGDTARTPFEPSGLVRVIGLRQQLFGRKVALVIFVGDHPHGYKDGSTGAYFQDELKRVDPQPTKAGA